MSPSSAPATTRIRGAGAFTGSEYAAVALLGGFGFAGAGVWLSGQFAGLLSGHGWPNVPFGQAFTIALTLPRHWGDPRRAWPQPIQRLLPGPIVMYSVMVLVFAVLAAFAVVVARRAWRGRQTRGMATPAQLAETVSARAVLARAGRIRPTLRGPAPADVAVELGTIGRRRLYAGLESSVLLLAAPRQGKTSQVIIPWLRTFPGPAVVTSVRTDVLQATASLRGGTAWLLDLDQGHPWPDRLRWSPIAGAQDFEVAVRRADVMVQVGKGGGAGDSSNAGFFGMTATNLLAAWLHTAAVTGRTMADVRQWSVNPADDTPITLLRGAKDAEPGVVQLLDGFYRQPEASTRASLWATVQTATSCLFGKAAANVFCGPPAESFDIGAFLRSESDTLYLVIDEKKAGKLAPLLTAFVDEIITTAIALAKTLPNERLDPPLGLILDEASNGTPLPDLPQLMSYAAGFGIFVVTVLQNLSAAERRWQKVGRQELWKNATVKIALGGLAGDDLEDFSRLAGTYREATHIPQVQRDGYSVNTTVTDRKTLAPERIRTLSERRRQALIIHATTPPVITRMVRSHESKHAADYRAAIADARTKLGLPPKENDASRLRRWRHRLRPGTDPQPDRPGPEPSEDSAVAHADR